MNVQHTSLQPAPRPMCAALAPLLPLLSLDKLDPEDAATAREHVATCDFCRSQLREFDALRDALRRHHLPARGAEPVPAEPAPMLTLATILGAMHGDDAGADEERAGRADHVAARPLSTRPGAPPVRGLRRGQGRWTGHGALAAALLIALLAGALFHWHNDTGRSAGTLVQGIVVPMPGLGTITEFPLPTTDSYPSAIVAGRDGNLWFTLTQLVSAGNGAVVYNGEIGRISPGGQLTEFPLPPADYRYPTGITLGPDGNLWFTEGGGNKIGRITPAGSIREFALPTSCVKYDCGPNDITLGPDGNLWFTDEDGLIGQITPAGSIKEFALPTTCGNPGSSCRPYGITLGPDGNLWFTESGSNKIGQITPAGSIKEFALPTTCGKATPLNSCYPYGITLGPDGNLWVTEGAGKIGRITPAGGITEFALPPTTCGVSPPGCGITRGPDGSLWFTESTPGYGGNKIGRITPAGSITEFAFPTDSQSTDCCHPVRITLDPDGNLWFTDEVTNTIDRLEIHYSG